MAEVYGRQGEDVLDELHRNPLGLGPILGPGPGVRGDAQQRQGQAREEGAAVQEQGGTHGTETSSIGGPGRRPTMFVPGDRGAGKTGPRAVAIRVKRV